MGPANRRDFSAFREAISTQPTAESRGAQFRPFIPSKWRFRCISACRAEFRRISPFAEEPTGWRARERPSFFSGFLEDISSQSAAESRGSPTSLPVQVSGDFSEFRPIGRNPPESRPFAAEPAGRMVRKQPRFFIAFWRYFHEIGRRIARFEIPPAHPKYVAISLNFGRSGGIPMNLAPSPQIRPDGGSAKIRYVSGFRGNISTRPTRESGGMKFPHFGPSKWQFR